MRVFVWKSYGNIEVCAADTIPQLSTLFKEICACLDDWHLDDIIVELDAMIEKNKTDIRIYYKAINLLLEEIEVGSHESFEYGTGFTNIRNM